jgi:hypothetical protein
MSPQQPRSQGEEPPKIRITVGKLEKVHGDSPVEYDATLRKRF